MQEGEGDVERRAVIPMSSVMLMSRSFIQSARALRFSGRVGMDVFVDAPILHDKAW